MPRLGRAGRKSAIFSVGAAAPIDPNDRWGFELWSEFEVPNAPAPTRDGRLFWAELEGPTASRLGRLLWAEVEVPLASRFGEIDWAELETPFAPRRGNLIWAEFGTGDVEAAAGILINARLVYIKPLRPHRRHPHLPNVFVPIEEERWHT
jgi:hypothetical protein